VKLSEELTELVDELLEAHDDTVRLSADLVLDWRWQAHVCYLRELGQLGREALASASAEAPHCDRAGRRMQSLDARRFRSNVLRRGARRCARHGPGKGSS
jgi:hypothetical protein